MNGKTIEKRLNKGYKVKGSSYQKAMKRARKEKKPLAQLLEKVVEYYAAGYIIDFKNSVAP